MPRNNGVDYIVTSGLEVGDVIIAEGAGLVREGATIKTADFNNDDDIDNDNDDDKSQSQKSELVSESESQRDGGN